MKHIKSYSEFNESALNKKTLDQLKTIRKLSKGIDIGDKIGKMSGSNLANDSNFIDDNPETMEDIISKQSNSNKKFKYIAYRNACF